MAANEINLTIKVSDDGNLKIVGKNAEKAADGLNKAGKSARTADRNLKGASQQSANGTKNFSKMAQGISGSLVPAYATLAANIFAITAAFGFLKESADFRVLYKLSRTDSSGVEQTFELFPGHDNLKDGEIIDVKNNSGRSDIPVRSSAEGEFNEYEFSVDELEQFTGFQIKIVMSGTNEARAPKFKDLRVIALA